MRVSAVKGTSMSLQFVYAEVAVCEANSDSDILVLFVVDIDCESGWCAIAELRHLGTPKRNTCNEPLFPPHAPCSKSGCRVCREDNALMQSNKKRWHRRLLSDLDFADVASSPGPVVAKLILSLPVWVSPFADQMTVV